MKGDALFAESLDRILRAARERSDQFEHMSRDVAANHLPNAKDLTPAERSALELNYSTTAAQLRDDVARWRSILDASRSLARAIEDLPSTRDLRKLQADLRGQS